MLEFNLISIFLAGLLGGTHCAGMCGGIVSAFSLNLPAGQARWPFQLACNLGRITSYLCAGAIAGAIGASSLLLNKLLPVQQVLYIIANVILIVLGLYLAGISTLIMRIEKFGAVLWRQLNPLLGRLLPIRSLPQGFAAGALWGWLPCGLVYTALISALSSGGTVRGATVMLAFGLGTLPNLMLMGMFASRVKPFLQHRIIRLIAGGSVATFGIVGLVRAFTL